MNKSVKDQWIDQLGNENLSNNMGDGIFPSPQEYIDNGINPETAAYWHQLGGWNIDRMRVLKNAIADLDSTGRRISIEEMDRLNLAYNGYTIAYMFCNGDLSIEQVKELID